MELYYSFSILIVLATIFEFINHRLLRLPSAIGIMIIAVSISLILAMFGDALLPKTTESLISLITKIDFTEILMGAMLNFLLFAAAIHINIKDLRENLLPVVMFSSVGIVISTFVVGIGAYYILPLVGVKMPVLYCLVFGALISPTDPVAVLSVLKNAKVSKSLETKVAGESLFNDGTAVVVFTVILQLATGKNIDLTLENILMLLIREAGGGLVLGFVLGFVALRAMQKINEYIFSVLVTLSVVMGGYLIAHSLHISGPLTMVSAGLLIGNHIMGHMDEKSFEVKSETRDYLLKFWELIDEILNAVLFLFIGLVLLMMKEMNKYILSGVICIAIVLIARWVSILLSAIFMASKNRFSPQTIKVLVWGAIRGGVSIALAISIPKGIYSNVIISLTYCVVVFSIIVQGLTIGKMVNPNKLAEDDNIFNRFIQRMDQRRRNK